MSNRSLHSFYC